MHFVNLTACVLCTIAAIRQGYIGNVAFCLLNAGLALMNLPLAAGWVFTTKLYRKYFPLSTFSVMRTDDYKKFEKWIDNFLRDIENDNEIRKRNAAKMGISILITCKCKITEEDITKIKEKIYKTDTHVTFSQLEEDDCNVLNVILRVHKKNRFILERLFGFTNLYYKD